MTNSIRAFLLVFALVFAACVPGLSTTAYSQEQDANTPDYVAWENTAARAEKAIEAGRASSMALEELRNQLADWRQQFGDARSTNTQAISTVRSQLQALGPVPEDGTESADVAAQREALNSKLAQLEAPIKIADLAYSRAEGLIKGIDQIIRERQTQEFLELGPSPLKPAHWKDGVESLFRTVDLIRGEFVAAWGNPVQKRDAQNDLPIFLLLVAVGLVLVLRGRRWSHRLMQWVLRDEANAARWIVSFVISIGTLVLPYLGTVALVMAVYTTGLVGIRSDLFLQELFPSVFVFLLARWLATRVFPRHETRRPPLNLSEGARYAGRWYGASLGITTGFYLLLQNLAELGGWSDAATNVVLFPVLIIGAFLLHRLSNLLALHGQACALSSGEEETFRNKCSRFLAMALKLLAFVAPVIAAVGYFKAAEALLLPSLMSLLVLAALLVIQRVVTEVYVLVSGDREDAADSLIPVLAGFILVSLSLPIFALIWGARVADLSELWTRFTEGVYVGETRISPAIFLTLAMVFVIGYIITRLVQGALKNSVLPKTKLDKGGRNAIVSGVGYIGIFLAAVIAITSAGIDLSSIALVAGALSVGIGFGLQTIVSNFVSGIILLIERPISEGDWIEVGGLHGTVRNISVRSTRIETFDRSDVIIPNSDLISGTVTNYTRGNTVGRVIVPVGVAYGTDTHKVEKILMEIAEAHPMVLANPAPYVVFQNFGASSLDFEIRAILRDVNWILNVKSDFNHEIARRFAQEGIEVPFAQRDIWIRNPEALIAVSGERSNEGKPDKAHLDDGDVGDGTIAESDGDGSGGEY